MSHSGNGTCYRVSCKYHNEKGQFKTSKQRHDYFENKLVTEDELREAYRVRLAKSGMKLVDIDAIPCKVYHAEKGKCYYVSYSFYDKQNEWKYFEPHHFHVLDKPLTKNEIIQEQTDKIKNLGGRKIKVTVNMCDRDKKNGVIDKFFLWLF